MSHADFFLPLRTRRRSTVRSDNRQESGLEEWSPLTNLRHIFLSSSVAPEPPTVHFTGDNRPYYAVTNQQSPPADSVLADARCLGIYNGITRRPIRRLFWTAATYVAI